MFNYLFNKTKEDKTVRKVEGEDNMNKKDWFKKVVILMAAIGFAVGYPDIYASEYSNIEYVDASTNLGTIYFNSFQGFSRADYLNRVGPGNAQTVNTPDGKYQVSMYFTGNSISEVAIIFKGVSADTKGDNREYVYTLSDSLNYVSIRGFGPQYNDYYTISVPFDVATARGDHDIIEPAPEPAPEPEPEPAPAPAPKPEPAPAPKPAPAPPASNNGGNSNSNQSSGSSGSSSTGNSDSSSSVSDNTSHYDNSQSAEGSGEDSYEETETTSDTHETDEEAEEETEEKAKKETKEKEVKESAKEPRTTAYPLKDFELTNWENKSDDDHVSVKSSHNKADDGSNITTAFYLAAGVITVGLAFVVTQKKIKNKV